MDALEAARVERRWRSRHLGLVRHNGALALSVVLLAACAMGRVVNPTPAANLAVSADELAVLSYNVQALPLFLGKWSATRRAEAIRPLIARYDLVLFQEAFTRANHLLPTAAHGVRAIPGSQGRVLWSKPNEAFPGFGNGLAMYALPSLVVDASQEVEFTTCSGKILGGGDCGSAKGFTATQVQFNGRPVHVYNTHVDAGDGEKDRKARVQQLAMLARHIERCSAGEAVIVGGDFNSRRGNAPDEAVLQTFAGRNGLHRVDVAMSPDWKQHLDYFFWRSGGATSLAVQRSGEDPAFQRGGRWLSDHPAIYVVVRVTGRAQTGRSTTTPSECAS